MNDKTFKTISDLNGNGQRLRQIKNELAKSGSGGRINKTEEVKNPPSAEKKQIPDKKEKQDFRQKEFEKKARQAVAEIFKEEAIEEAINKNIASEKKIEKARKIVQMARKDLDAAASDPEWYKLTWRDGELRNALRKYFIRQVSGYSKTEKLESVKNFSKAIEKLCEPEKEKREIAVVIKDEKDKNPPKPQIKPEAENTTLLVQRAVVALAKALEKNKNLKIQDIESLLQEGMTKWEYLSKREQELVKAAFEKMKKSEAARSASDPRPSPPEIKLEAKPEKKRTKDDILDEIKIAAETDDDEATVKLKEELDDFDKTGKQLFEEAQAVEAEGKALKSIEKDFKNKLLTLKKIKAKEDKESNIISEESSSGSLLNDEIRTGDQIFLLDNEGRRMVTSPVKFIQEEGEDYIIETETSIYRLGYENMPPDYWKKKIKDTQPESEKETKKPLEEALKEMYRKNQEVIDAEFADEKSGGGAETAPEAGVEEAPGGEVLPEAPEIAAETGTENDVNDKELQEKLERVEETRKAYLEIDYKKKTGYKRLAGFFGNILKFGPDKNYERDEEVAHLRAIYDNALFDYKNAVLDKAKAGNASNKEMADIVKFFDVEANLNLRDVHDQVKIENQEGSRSGFIREHSKEIIERYKKMPLIKKIAIGAAFGFAGMGAVYTGAAMAGVIGGAVALRRIFLGMVTGTSVALTAEKITRRRAEKKIDRGAKRLAEKLESLSEDEKLKYLEKKISGTIKDEDNSLNKIKNKNLRNLGLGVLAGTLASNYHLLGDKISGLFGVSEVAEKTGETAGEWKAGGLDYDRFREIILGDKNFAETVGAEEGLEASAETSGSFAETAGPGDSVWKMAERQLEQHFGEKFTSLEGSEKTHIIDAIKDRVAANPAAFGLQNIDQISVGQEIDFSDIMKDSAEMDALLEKGSNLSDEALESISENNETIRSWAENHPGESLTSEKVEEILGAKTEAAAEQAQAGGRAAGENIPVAEADTAAPETAGIKSFSAEFQNNLNELTGDNPMTRGRNWEIIDDWEVDHAIKNQHPDMPNLDKSILGIEEKYEKVIGSEARHLPRETMKEWVSRVTRAAAAKGR